MPVHANDIPVHHRLPFTASLSRLFGRIGRRCVIHIGKSNRQTCSKNHTEQYAHLVIPFNIVCHIFVCHDEGSASNQFATWQASTFEFDDCRKPFYLPRSASLRPP